MSETKTNPALALHPEVWEQLAEIRLTPKARAERPKHSKRHTIFITIALIASVLMGGVLALATSSIH